MKRFSQFRQREGNRFKQRLVPFFNGVYGVLAKLRKAVGNPIVISDASDEALSGLKVFGKSTQNGTPTPAAPVAIVSVENPTVKVDSQNLSVPYTLHGIPVTSGGNYTDANGQQWICDEVDFERGVYVQRIFRKVFDGTETLRNNWFPIMVHEIESQTFYADVDSNVICNYFDHTYIGNVHGTTLAIGSLDKLGYTNVSEIQELMVNKYEDGQPVVLQYCLKTPIETPLTTAQIEAYKALHTNEPNTTILNDQNAWMEVMYTSK